MTERRVASQLAEIGLRLDANQTFSRQFIQQIREHLLQLPVTFVWSDIFDWAEQSAELSTGPCTVTAPSSVGATGTGLDEDGNGGGDDDEVDWRCGGGNCRDRNRNRDRSRGRFRNL